MEQAEIGVIGGSGLYVEAFLGGQPAQLRHCRGRPQNDRPRLLEDRLHGIGHVPGILGQQNAHALEIVRACGPAVTGEQVRHG